MSTVPKPAPDYVLGQSEVEQKRLLNKAAIVRSFTEGYFRAGGLSRGMRVLDLGCGMGDVSLLAAEMTGPAGRVVGIDRDAGVVEKARARASMDGYGDRVNFVQANVNEFTDTTQFDAVVGRYVLLYQPDPAASLRHVTTLLRSGGVVIFHEMDFSDCPAWPEPAMWRRVGSILSEAFRRAGVPPDFGMRLTRTFLDASLPRPTIHSAAPVGGEAGSYLYGWLAETARSLWPRIEQFGLATADELQIDTLAQRMEAEAVALGSQVVGPMQFGAWATKP